MPDHELIARRKVLVAAIDDLTAMARFEDSKGRPPEPYLLEATRLVLRLKQLQQEIEAHDID